MTILSDKVISTASKPGGNNGHTEFVLCAKVQILSQVHGCVWLMIKLWNRYQSIQTIKGTNSKEIRM